MSGFIFRWLLAFVALAAVYNPTQYNYYTWAQANYEAQQPLVIGIGVMLGLLILLFLIGAIRAFGLIGFVLFVIILALVGYILQLNGTITLDPTPMNVWGALAIGGFLLALLNSLGSGRKSRSSTRRAANA